LIQAAESVGFRVADTHAGLLHYTVNFIADQ